MTDAQLSAGQIARGPLELEDLTLVGIILDDTYTFDPDHDTAAIVAAYEVEGDNYDRLTATGRCVRVGSEGVMSDWRLFLDDVTTTNLADVSDRGGIYWVKPGATDDDRLTVGWAADVGGAVNPYEPTWDDGLASFPIGPLTTDIAEAVYEAVIAELSIQGTPL